MNSIMFVCCIGMLTKVMKWMVLRDTDSNNSFKRSRTSIQNTNTKCCRNLKIKKLFLQHVANWILGFNNNCLLLYFNIHNTGKLIEMLAS